MKQKVLVNKIIPFSSVDGPGNRTGIFLQHCNFDCAYCHNPETINLCVNCGACVKACPVNALSMIDGKVVWDKNKCVNCDTCIKTCTHCSSPKTTMMSVDEVMDEVEKYAPFIEGITTSGGECTLAEDFLIELFKKAKAKGLTCFVDSNGSNLFSEMPELLSVTDKVMLDVKAWSSDMHAKYIAKDNSTVLSNLRFLLEKDKMYEVRTVIVPGMLNNEETVDNVSRVIAEINPDVRYKIIKYRPMGVRNIMDGIKTPTNEYIDSLKDICEKNGCRNIVIV